MSSSKKNTAIGILAALIFLLLGLAAWLIFSNSGKSDAITEKQRLLEEQRSLKAQFEEQYNNTVADLDRMSLENDNLKVIIDEQRAELEEQRTRINSLLSRGYSAGGGINQQVSSINEEELNSAREMIKALVGQRDQFVASVDSLSQLTQYYAAQSATTKQEVTRLQDVITEERVTFQVEKESFEKTAVKLMSDNEVMKKKLNASTALNVKDVKFDKYLVDKNGTYKSTSKLSKADVMQFSYDVIPNPAAAHQQQVNVIRILQPNNQILSNSKVGSGMFTTTNGDEMKYSMEKKFMYTGQSTNVVFAWPLSGSEQPGDYIVEIYDNDALVGKSTITLK